MPVNVPIPPEHVKQIQTLLGSLVAALTPPRQITVSEWAEQNRRLSSEASAVRGKWVCWPFQREPMDCLSSHHPASTVVLMCASQMLKTELVLNMLGYIIDVDPGPCLLVEPREMDAESLSEDRIDPMIRDTPCLKNRVKGVKLHKRFLGGHFTLQGAISPSGLAMRPIRYLLMDEVDRYPESAGREGDPVFLASQRTTAFHNKKILLCSTPTLDGKSRIYQAWKNSDQRAWQVPCCYCGAYQELVWDNLVFDEQAPVTAEYRCSQCEKLIPHTKKYQMEVAGKWVAGRPGHHIPGFHLNALHSMTKTWTELAQQYVSTKGNSESRKSFVNTVLAETFKEKGQSLDKDKLKGKGVGKYPGYMLDGKLPQEVVILTGGVDIQGAGWGELHIWGWGSGRQRWLIDVVRVEGDLYREEFWEELGKWTQAQYLHPSGALLPIARICVDSGYAATLVYQWVRRYPNLTVIKGYPSGLGLVGRPQPIEHRTGKNAVFNARVFPVNTSMAKMELYGQLEMEAVGPGYVHMPGGLMARVSSNGGTVVAEYLDEWLSQLTAEEYVVSYKRGGGSTGQWVLIRAGARNEALDAAVYARAAGYLMNMDHWTPVQWAQLEQGLKIREMELLVEGGAKAPGQGPAHGQPQVPALEASEASGGLGAGSGAPFISPPPRPSQPRVRFKIGG